jgi:hypothetical protein
MNIKRKIQLTSTAIVCSGAVALGVLSPPALAVTCHFKLICVISYSTCVGLTPAQRVADCQHFADPGCTAYSAFCEPPGSGCGNLGGIVCFYH